MKINCGIGGKVWRVVLNKQFFIFFIGAFLISAWWFLKVYQVYGNPLQRGGSALADASGWNGMLRARPNGWILYLIGIPFLCPPFAGVFFSIKRFAREIYCAFRKKTCDYHFIFLWVIILTFAFYFRGKAGQEHRRMLPVYACIAVLAGYCLIDCASIQDDFDFLCHE